MHDVELLVRLKIPDVTALTAANALRRRMGYARILKALRRADYYRLDLSAPSMDAALALGVDVAEKTNIFVNPNKHVYELQPTSREPLPSENGVHRVHLLVTDPEDGSAQGALSALQGRLGYGADLAGLLKGILWTLDLECASAEEARQIATNIAVTRARDHGLLANPHFQQCEVW